MKSKQCKPKIFLKVTVAYWQEINFEASYLSVKCHSVFSYSLYDCIIWEIKMKMLKEMFPNHHLLQKMFSSLSVAFLDKKDI